MSLFYFYDYLYIKIIWIGMPIIIDNHAHTERIRYFLSVSPQDS